MYAVEVFICSGLEVSAEHDGDVVAHIYIIAVQISK